MKPARSVLPDHEVVELLRDEPELLAIADAVAATQERPRRRRVAPRLAALAAVLAAAAGLLTALPGGDADGALLSDALAALGSRPVVHAVIEARLPDTNVVDLGTGRATPQTVAIEYWFDEPRGRLLTELRRGGVLVDEFLESRAGATAGRGPVVTAPGSEPALHPALAGFVTRYRQALATGVARVGDEGRVGGRRVVWLSLRATGGPAERVAVDAESFAPVLITPLDRDGRPSAFSWRVRTIETLARVEADFAPPQARAPRPYRGDVRASRPVSSDQVPRVVGWPALWLGQSWNGLRLVSLELQTLTRGYPPGTSKRVARGVGLRLRYAVDRSSKYVEISQAPVAEPAYAFANGAMTFGGNPIPREGEMELLELAGGSGRGRTVGQLRSDGVYLTVWASSRALCLEAARALKRIAT